jgi:hypothetical protein
LIPAALQLWACSSTPAAEPATPPEWFKQRESELKKEGFPQLLALPAPVAPSKNDQEWNSVRQSVDAQGNILRASPRAKPADADTSAIGDFEAKARSEVAPQKAPPSN